MENKVKKNSATPIIKNKKQTIVTVKPLGNDKVMKRQKSINIKILLKY